MGTVSYIMAGLVFGAGLTRANTNVLTIQSQRVTNQFEAYALVSPISVITVQALQAGMVTGLDVEPGSTVREGQKLGALTGPEIEAAQVQVEAQVTSAKVKLEAAEKAFQVAQQQLTSHLSTQQQVADAQSALAGARGALEIARSGRTAFRFGTELVAPGAGTVLAVSVGNGQRVRPGQAILTLEPAGNLWLKATYYGSDLAAIHPGMTGEFRPVGDGKPIPVRVTTLFGALNSDGGEWIGMVPLVADPHWQNGQFGTVRLNGEVRSLVSVPTRALILDQGKWWVLVQTPQGERARQVTPGCTRGWQTFIENGLEPGTKVQVENAYLEFHRRISSAYRPPD